MAFPKSKDPTLTKQDVSRFLAFFDKRTRNECWEWKGGKVGIGYGGFDLAGTPRENTLDMIAKNRHSHGVNHAIISGNTRLTLRQVVEIRRLGSIAELNQTQIAKKFNISRCHVSQIIRRKVWDFDLTDTP